MRDKALGNSEYNNCTEMLCHLLDQTHDNGAALLSLVECYIGHFASRYCNLSFQDRQDIHQEVAISIFCNGEKVRGNCSRSWVYAVVRNQCINHVRKQNRRLFTFKQSDDPEENTVGSFPALQESVDAELMQQIDCLQNIFNQVESQPTGKADISIYTQYAFGLSYKEISAHSKRTVDAVGRRISLLKNRLKKLIDECC